MKETFNIATLAQQIVIEQHSFARGIREHHSPVTHIEVGFAQLLHELRIWQAFAEDRMVAPGVL